MHPNIKALGAILFSTAIYYNGAVSAQTPGTGTPSSPSFEALNPQPLPPKALQGIKPNSGINALNPQPLPPKEIQSLQRPAGVTTLSPQPLPPSGNPSVRTIKSLRESEGLPETANVIINGKTANVGDLRKGVVVSGSIAKATDTVFQFKVKVGDGVDRTSAGAAVSDYAKKSPTLRPMKAWVRHELPKERWKQVGCGDTHNDHHVRNHCNGSDYENAREDAICVSKLLAKSVSGGLAVYCTVPGGPRAGGFHSTYNASNQAKKSGVDVFEIQINPACSFEHWWSSAYSTVKVDSMVPQQGTVRAIARWTTDRCIKATATFLGATVDEDYACFAGYHNTQTTAQCPAGISP